MGTKQLNTCPAPVQLFRTFIRPQHQKPSTPAHVHKMHNQRPPFFGRGWLNDLTMASTQSQSQRRPSQGQADQRGRSPNCHFWHSFVNPAIKTAILGRDFLEANDLVKNYRCRYLTQTGTYLVISLSTPRI